MGVEVDAVTDKTTQHVGTEHDQHRADRRLERLLEIRRDHRAEPQHGPAEQHQRDRVADAPGNALAQRLTERSLAGRERGDRGEVIGLGRVLHAEQQADDEDRERRHAGAAPMRGPYRRRRGRGENRRALGQRHRQNSLATIDVVSRSGRRLLKPGPTSLPPVAPDDRTGCSALAAPPQSSSAL